MRQKRLKGGNIYTERGYEGRTGIDTTVFNKAGYNSEANGNNSNGNAFGTYNQIQTAGYENANLVVRGGGMLQYAGCFTCTKGLKKINGLFKSLSTLIPKYFQAYKKAKRTKSSSVSKSSKSKHTKRTKGGSWFSSDCDKCGQSKTETITKNYNESVLNTYDLDLNKRSDIGVYNVDTSAHVMSPFLQVSS